MRGFLNECNTCYFNTSIQCLFNVHVITNHFFKNPYEGKCMFTIFYQVLLKKYWSNEKSPLDLTPLLYAFQNEFPRFKNDDQHDVQEAILCIIDILEKSKPEIKTWLYGKKTQETIWPGGKSENEEDFSVHVVRSKGKDMGKILEDSTRWNVLENFEDTDGKVYNVATTRMIFSKLPQVLMISFDTKSHIKIIEKLILDTHEYELFACAIHAGIQNDGHYISFIKRKTKWFFINDAHVREHELPEEGGFYFMMYNLKNPPS